MSKKATRIVCLVLAGVMLLSVVVGVIAYFL